MTKICFNDILKKLGIPLEMIDDIAFKTGLIIRKRLIKASDFLYAFCLESVNGNVSYNDIAAHLDAGDYVSVSRQAIWKKGTEASLDFFKIILAGIIKSKINDKTDKHFQRPSKFKRILVQDSTIIKLPTRLFGIFSGVSNGHSKVCNARIQGTYDILSESFVEFSIDPYTKNDLKAAPETNLEFGDLSLRDRGYLTNSEIERHKKNNADCIYRHKFGTILLDEITEEPIDLNEVVKKNTKLDMNVKLNNHQRTVVRIVAEPVVKKVADERRRKAKKENKSTPSKEYLELLSWSIFITTLPCEEATFDEIFSLYCLRWRIEIIFKSWKSNLSFDKIHNVSKIQLRIILFARFIMILICTQFVFTPCKHIIKKYYNKYLSLLKTLRYLTKHSNLIIDIINELYSNKKDNKHAIERLSKYCTYDKRNRVNFEQKLELMFA